MKKLSLIFAAILLVAGIFLIGDMVAARITSPVPIANENVVLDPVVPVPQIPETLEHTPVSEDTVITIIAAGDIMFHYPQVISAKSEDGSYDFSSPFEFIKGYVQAADLAIANLETVIAGDGEAPKGYPRFRSPKEVLDGIKEAGFDVLVTANNHTADRGKAGIIKTIEEIEIRQLEYVGTSKDEKRDFIIKDVKGVKIGLLSYTFGLNGLESLLTQEELQRMVNLTDKERMSASIDEARSKGAELIVVYLHWGNEYHRQSSVEQRELAVYLADNGADLILGSHPHVVQELEVITSGQKEVTVVYSMGNLLSNQRYDTMGVSYTEDGLMIAVKVIKDGYTEELNVESVMPIPTWVNRWSVGSGKFNYRILPVSDVLSGDLELEISPEALTRIQKSLNDTMDTLDGLE